MLESVRKAPQAPELVIVDDGELSPAVVGDLRSRASAAGVGSFRYLRNPRGSGLYDSRLVGIAQAKGAVLFFLDDDVTIAPEYLATLSRLYERYPRAAGIGGVDQLETPRSWPVAVLQRAFLVDSGRPGRFSPSGFVGSVRRWPGQTTEFESEYLAGCNMSFRREVLTGLGPVPWLGGYSLGEDLYISHVASQAGELIVSPALRVWHDRSRVSRDALARVARARVGNTFQILRLRGGSPINVVALLWTVTWLVLKDTLRLVRLSQVPGYVQGVTDVLRALWSGEGPALARGRAPRG